MFTKENVVMIQNRIMDERMGFTPILFFGMFFANIINILAL